MSIPVEMIIDDALDDAQTLANAGFYWRETDGVKVLICKPLEDAGFVNGFSTRLGGVSAYPANALNLAGFNEDTDENIYENRRRFLSVFGGDLKLTSVWQVHGDAIKTVRNEADAAETNDKFDGIVSDLKGFLAGVKTADCVPVLIGDRVKGAYAAIHAGWRGTVASIVMRGIEGLQEEYAAEPGDLFAAIGPAATCKSYEIGSDVIDAFGEAFTGSEKYFKPASEGHAYIDLHLANKDQLLAGGVSMENIFTAPFCTMERTDLFFSYRVEKKLFGRTGRLMSVIGRRE